MTAAPWDDHLLLPMPSAAMLGAVWQAAGLPNSYLAQRREQMRRCTAFHEAGHLVMLLAFGCRNAGARLFNAPDEAGVCGLAYPVMDAPPGKDTPPTHRAGAIARAALLHAGIQSELLAAGLIVKDEIRLPSQKDHCDADAVLRPLFHRPPHGYCQAVARSHLSHNWRLVNHIADTLAVQGEWRANSSTPAVSTLDAGSLFAAVAEYEARLVMHD